MQFHSLCLRSNPVSEAVGKRHWRSFATYKVLLSMILSPPSAILQLEHQYSCQSQIENDVPVPLHNLSSTYQQ